jgi:hypothetical protein
MGVDPSTVYTWRRRGSLPYADVIRLAVENLINLNWLFTETGGVDEPFISGYMDMELLAISIEMARRWVGRRTNLTASEEAAFIFPFYSTLVESYIKELRSGEGRRPPRRDEILQLLRHERALPDASSPQSKRRRAKRPK